ncbi:MAG: hypothetical protein K2X54_27850 [Methylobacterium organophilum]|nr:hypothetical protein [Methylobacterium organophilum]
MQPGVHDFPPLTRGDTETLGVILQDQSVFSQQAARGALKSGDVVRWIVTIPGKPDLVKSTEAGGGLNLKLATAYVSWALSAADWTALAGPGPFAYRVRVNRASGEVQTYLKGNLSVDG